MPQSLPDLTPLSYEELAEFAGGFSDAELADLMASPERTVLLDAFFGRMVANANPDKIKDQDAVIHFEITDRPDGGTDRYELVVRDGACTVTRNAGETARVTVALDGPRFVRVASGKADGAKLFLRRKIRINGDLVFGGRVFSWFDVPTD
jgi:alkyl sulfatase BDS1-like metallo-beta-lactamase superfamily hydrolase